jgi:hypothetical protein
MKMIETAGRSGPDRFYGRTAVYCANLPPRGSGPHPKSRYARYFVRLRGDLRIGAAHGQSRERQFRDDIVVLYAGNKV